LVPHWSLGCALLHLLQAQLLFRCSCRLWRALLLLLLLLWQHLPLHLLLLISCLRSLLLHTLPLLLLPGRLLLQP
jgi:hypothetical protein